MAESRRTRCRAWVYSANADMKSWVREPQPSVFNHTFRDRQPNAEIGPSNGHISGRKYIPRCSVCFLPKLGVRPCLCKPSTQALDRSITAVTPLVRPPKHHHGLSERRGIPLAIFCEREYTERKACAMYWSLQEDPSLL